MTTLRVWAPNADDVQVEVRPAADDGQLAAAETHPMNRVSDSGYWETSLPELRAGSDYAFRLDGDDVSTPLGPDGNYLPRLGPYFTESHTTPWGAAVNLDAPGSDEVRRFIVDNALMWLGDYHCDGLRLDAVHALADTRATHVL